MMPCAVTLPRLPALLAALALLLAACAAPEIGTVSPEERADRLAARGQHAAAAAAYIGLAADATGRERDRLTLLAAAQWLDAGDGRRARIALGRMRAPAERELRWLWDSNHAALALREGRPDDALERLEALRREPLPTPLRRRIEALFADAWFQKGDPIRAIELYRQRETWFTTPRAVRNNRERLWAGLLASRPQVLRDALETTGDPEVEGWLSMGALATSTGRQGIGWTNGVLRWQQAHAGHPAMALLEDIELPQPGELGYPARIALLLPLSGDNAAAGRAVQHGFLGAYFAAAADLPSMQRVDVYDTGAGGARAYTRAVEDGAAFIVGPLLRGNVVDVATGGLLPVPLLTLNYLPDHLAPPPGLYQFALAPEDEAVAAAERALADGYRRGLALVPNNDWGRRLLRAFANAFENAGGTLLDARDYQPERQDFSFEIESLLLLSQSVDRYRRLRANIGAPLQFDPRRRQDAEFIFLPAPASTGRLLKSQLKFHYAGDLPVYSTSRIYAMDGRSNSDLNGLMFAATPWVVAPPRWIAHLPPLYRRSWPAERRLGRLHALGYDAYHLVTALYAEGGETLAEIDGATGRLYLDAGGRVHRRPAWARFENGEVVALPPAGRQERFPAPDEDAETDPDIVRSERFRGAPGGR